MTRNITTKLAKVVRVCIINVFIALLSKMDNLSSNPWSWVKYTTIILQSLEKSGASPELIEYFAIAIKRVEKEYPDADEAVKAQLAQLTARNRLLEERNEVLEERAITSKRHYDEIRDRAKWLLSQMDELTGMLRQKDEVIDRRRDVTKKQDIIIEGLKSDLTANLFNPN